MSSGPDTPQSLNTHYHNTLENFKVISSENLHFLGYFVNRDNSLATALRNLNYLFLTKAELTSNDLVLDVGCGSGGPACYMAETANCNVVGIDIGEEQLSQARQQAEEKQVIHLVKFLHQDAISTTFEDEIYDVALMIGSASHMPAKEALFAECARVIKKGGRLVFGDAVMVNPEWFNDQKNAVKIKILNLFFGDPQLESIQGYQSLLQNSGFQISNLDRLTPHVLRSFELWEKTFEEKSVEFINYLGKSRYRGLVKAVRIIREIVYDGHFDAVIMTAKKP